MCKIILAVIFLSSALTLANEQKREKVSCKYSLNEEFGSVCLLENVSRHTRTEIDVESFKYVFFRDSAIEFFTHEFTEQLVGVEYLNVNGVGLEFIDGSALGRLGDLLIFWGSQNEIQTLDEYAFSGNKKLELICLKFNKISAIHKNAFRGLESLYSLDLSSNRLRRLEKVFDSLESLVVLDLSSNSLEYLDDEVFEKSKHLTQLSLSKNNLKFLDAKALDPLVNLKFIDLCFNKLSVISRRLFKYNWQLRKVLLCSNQIRAIDTEFFENEKNELSLVLLRHNKCTDTDVDLIGGKLQQSEMSTLKMCFQNFNDLFPSLSE